MDTILVTLAAHVLARLGLLVALLGGYGAAHAQGDRPGCTHALTISSSREGNQIKVNAQLNIPRPVRIAWDVMTDYNNAARFIHNVTHSQALPQGADKWLVNQTGWVGWGKFGTSIQTNYMVQLNPTLHQVSGHLVSGDVKAMKMNASLAASDEHNTVLHYALTVEPGALVPAFLAEGVLRQQAHDSFEDLAAEMQRRSPACPPSPPIERPPS